MAVPIRARLSVSAHQGHLICQCPSGPGYMAVPIRARLSVSAHQGHLICQCPSGPGYMAVPIRARLSVSAHQGHLICQCPSGPFDLSVPIRARLSASAHQGQVICQCPSGPGYYVSAQQGQVSVPSRSNSVAGVVYLRVTASIAVVSAPHQSTNRAQYPTLMRTLVHWSNRSQCVVL